MNFLTDEAMQIDDLLDRICAKLQLNKTRIEKVETSYNALCSFIENDKKYFSSFHKIDFYAQGSYSIQTTVKPKFNNEFDLDFILEIYGSWQNEDPMKLLKELYRIFKESDLYCDKVELKNRCVRINYENDFHIDILPSFPEDLGNVNTKLKVPDKNSKWWAESNPKGFANWFNEKTNLVDMLLLEKRVFASVEPLPRSNPHDLSMPLRRAVQLMKRYRDSYYKNEESNGVRSIILITLCGNYYEGQVSSYETINSILQTILEKMKELKGKPLEIYNPTNEKEKFSEKWDENSQEYKEFCLFIKDFKEQWNSILELSTIKEKALVLQKLFGENVVSEAFSEQANDILEFRKKGQLGVQTLNGNLILGNSLNIYGGLNKKEVQKHTFYGK